MTMLHAICPRNGSRISTGISTDENTIAAVANEKVLVRCEHCGTYHAIWVRDLVTEPDRVAEPV